MKVSNCLCLHFWAFKLFMLTIWTAFSFAFFQLQIFLNFNLQFEMLPIVYPFNLLCFQILKLSFAFLKIRWFILYLLLSSTYILGLKNSFFFQIQLRMKFLSYWIFILPPILIDRTVNKTREERANWHNRRS